MPAIPTADPCSFWPNCTCVLFICSSLAAQMENGFPSRREYTATWPPLHPPPPPGPPPPDDPDVYLPILIPFELFLIARPRSCQAEMIWHPNHGLLRWTDPRRPQHNSQIALLRRGYAQFNYDLKNASVCFWLSSIIFMRWAKFFWDALRWNELSELACVCRQFRRTRIVMLLKGCTPRASIYWHIFDPHGQHSDGKIEVVS